MARQRRSRHRHLLTEARNAMGNVTLLQKAKPPDKALVALLEELLEAAKAGRLEGLCGVATYLDQDCPDYLQAGLIDWWAMSGHLMHHARDIVLEEDEAEE